MAAVKDNIQVEELSITPFVRVLTYFSAIGGFLFGYDTGVVSGALILLKETFQLNTVWQELFVSVTIASAAVAALMGGPLNNHLGRRPVIIIASTVFTSGAVVLGLAPNKEMLIVGRIVIGIGVGLASMTVPMYIAEVAPAHLRGRLVMINACCITGGQFVAGLIDGVFSYWSWGWRCMLGLAAVPSLVQLIGFMFLPESPRWLIMNGELDSAREAVKQIYGQDSYEQQYELYLDSVRTELLEEEKDKKNESVIWRILTTPAVRRAVIVGSCLQILQQLAGINTIMYYSASIIRMSGVEDDTSVIWMASIVSFTNFAFTFVGLYFVDRLGRRKLSLGSLTGVMLCQVYLALAFFFIAKTSPDVSKTFPSNNTDAVYCNTFISCDSCTLHSSCGFCYDKHSLNHTLDTSFCLPVAKLDLNESSLGPCSPSSHTTEYHWALDYCPSAVSFLALIGLILYLMCFAPGMGPIPWIINSEIYPGWARSTCNSISASCNWTVNLLVSMTFLSLTEILTKCGTFSLYAVICFLGGLFIYFFVPETKGLPLEDVTKLFSQPLCSSRRSRGESSEYQPIQERDALIQA